MAGPEKAEDDVAFLCGALRSGTTLLALMIGAHPRLTRAGEMDFLFECPRSPDGTADIEAYRQALRTNRIFEASGVRIDERLDHDDLVRSFVDQKRERDKRLVVTIHRNFTRIPAIYANARYIHLLRDPRDVARSSISMGWSGNVYYGVDHWIDSEKDFEALERMVEADRIMTIHHRDLILDPEGELSRVSAFLGVPYDPLMLSYPETSTYDAPDPSVIDVWKKKLTPKEVGLIEGKAGGMMAPRGFTPSDYPSVQPGASKRAMLAIQNRASRIGHSFKRYGAFLTIMEILGRRLAIAPLAAFAQRKINAKSARYLK